MSEGGVKFTIPAHPGSAPSDDPKVLAKEEAQHKSKILDHDVCARVVQVMNYFIDEAVYE